MKMYASPTCTPGRPTADVSRFLPSFPYKVEEGPWHKAGCLSADHHANTGRLSVPGSTSASCSPSDCHRSIPTHRPGNTLPPCQIPSRTCAMPQTSSKHHGKGQA